MHVADDTMAGCQLAPITAHTRFAVGVGLRILGGPRHREPLSALAVDEAAGDRGDRAAFSVGTHEAGLSQALHQLWQRKPLYVLPTPAVLCPE